MISRLAALGLLLSILTALGTGVGAPLLRHYHEQVESIEQARHQIRGYQRVAASRDGLRQRLAEMERRHAGERLYLNGATASLAAADLQRIATRLIGAARGQVISTQVLPVLQEAGYQRIGIEVRMRAPQPAVLSLLQQIHASRPVLFIDRASMRQVIVRVREGGTYRTEAQLDFSFELQGYLRETS